MSTKVTRVLDRLKELFSEEFTDIDLLVTNTHEVTLSAYAIDIELSLNNIVESYYDIADILEYDVETIEIGANNLGISTYRMPAAEIFTDLIYNKYI